MVFGEILSKADMGIIDGFGLWIILKLKGIKEVERFSGVDVVYELGKLCQKNHKKIMMIGGKPGVAASARDAFRKLYPHLQIDSYIGPNISYKLSHVHPYAESDDEVITEIHAKNPDVLIVGLGAVKQEQWLANHRLDLPQVKIMIGVGGALDMIAGVFPRAPRVMRHIGLEWLWRLLLEPSRALRIFRAVIMFPIIASRKKIIFHS